MGGSTKTTQTTNQTSEQNPWAPAIGPVNDIIARIKGQIPNTALTAAESRALDTLAANAAEGNVYAPQIGELTIDLLSGGSDHTGRVKQAFEDFKTGMTPIAQGAHLDPTGNPYYRTVFDDVSNRVNGLFAGAGRDLSGAHLKTLSRGIAEGVAPLYEAERNRQTRAISDLYNAAQGTTSLLSTLDQNALANRQAGIGAATAALQARDAGAKETLAAEALRRSLPLQNIAAVENLLVPLAQLGGTSHMQGVSTGTRAEPLLQQILSGVGGLSMLGKSGAFGSNGWLLGGSGSLASGLGTGLAGLLGVMSDRRVKNDVEEVGELYDGSPVYAFRYVGDPVTRLGLMAQDVEQRRPDAVTEAGGLKSVDYGKATQLAGVLGRLGAGRSRRGVLALPQDAAGARAKAP